MKLRQTLILGALAALVGGGYYYFAVYQPALAAKRAQAGAAAPLPPVVVATVSQQAMPVQYSTIGTVQQYTTVSIKSLVDGQIFKAGFQEGQYVHRGDLLFQIDPRPFQAALQQAQANLERDKAQTVRADLDLKRYTELSKKEWSSQQQFEQARATADGAHASVLADQAAIDQAKLNIEYSQIRSPIEGRTGNMLINVGNLVKANDTAALVMINQTRPPSGWVAHPATPAPSRSAQPRRPRACEHDGRATGPSRNGASKRERARPLPRLMSISRSSLIMGVEVPLRLRRVDHGQAHRGESGANVKHARHQSHHRARVRRPCASASTCVLSWSIVEESSNPRRSTSAIWRVEDTQARLVGDGVHQLRESAAPRHLQSEVGEEQVERDGLLHHRRHGHALKPAAKYPRSRTAISTTYAGVRSRPC